MSYLVQSLHSDGSCATTPQWFVAIAPNGTACTSSVCAFEPGYGQYVLRTCSSSWSQVFTNARAKLGVNDLSANVAYTDSGCTQVKGLALKPVGKCSADVSNDGAGLHGYIYNTVLAGASSQDVQVFNDTLCTKLFKTISEPLNKCQAQSSLYWSNIYEAGTGSIVLSPGLALATGSAASRVLQSSTTRTFSTSRTTVGAVSTTTFSRFNTNIPDVSGTVQAAVTGISTVIIIAIVAGVIFWLAVCGAIIYFCCIRPNRQQQTNVYVPAPYKQPATGGDYVMPQYNNAGASYNAQTYNNNAPTFNHNGYQNLSNTSYGGN
ncbi:hypothetical protein BC830DRAFT_1114741 [Chytriomyces sp. MP71]|nr:hypothetical protein BC830DRAFT_1114741 [Chytriomyces sp. MP71]